MARGSIADRNNGPRVREKQAHHLKVPGRGRVEEGGLSILIHEVDLHLGPPKEQPHYLDMAGERGLTKRRPTHVILEIDLDLGTLQQEFDHPGVATLGSNVQGGVLDVVCVIDFDLAATKQLFDDGDAALGHGADQDRPKIVVVAIVDVSGVVEQQLECAGVARQASAVKRRSPVYLIRVDHDAGSGKELPKLVLRAQVIDHLVEQRLAVSILLIDIAAGDAEVLLKHLQRRGAHPAPPLVLRQALRQIESELSGDQRDDSGAAGAQCGHERRDAAVSMRIAGLVDVDVGVLQDSQNHLGPVLLDRLLDKLPGRGLGIARGERGPLFARTRGARAAAGDVVLAQALEQ